MSELSKDCGQKGRSIDWAQNVDTVLDVYFSYIVDESGFTVPTFGLGILIRDTTLDCTVSRTVDEPDQDRYRQ